MPIIPVSGEIKSQSLNDNFSYLDSQVESISIGPFDTYTSLAQLNAAYPNGRQGFAIVLEADGETGYMYTWDGTQWKKGGLAQSQGIADRTVSPSKLTDSVRLSNYPFISSAITNGDVLDAISEIKIYTDDTEQEFYISAIRVNDTYSGNVDRYAFNIVDRITGGAVFSFGRNNYVPESYPETLQLYHAASGRTCEITIDWSKFTQPSYINMTYDNTGILNVLKHEKSSKLPFGYRTTVPFGLRKAIVDLKIYTDDISERYCLVLARRKHTLYPNGTVFSIYRINEDNSLGSREFLFSKDDYTPAKNIEILKINGTSNRTCEITIDWREFAEGIGFFDLNYLQGEIDASKIMLNQTSSDESNQSINTYLIDYNSNRAYFLQNGFFDVDINGVAHRTNLFVQSIRCMFVGPSIAIDLIHDTYDYNFVCRVDGGTFKTVTVTSSGVKNLYNDLSDEEHYLEIYTSPAVGTTQENSPYYNNGAGSFTFKGFDTKTYPIHKNGKRILFFGDSITAGSGDSLGLGFAGRTAEMLGVDYLKYAQPGGALVLNTQRPYLPTTQQLAFWGDNGKQHYIAPERANLLVVNIGTNDKNTPVSIVDYKTGLINLVNRFKRRWPDVPIAIMRPLNGSYATQCAEVSDELGCHYVSTVGWDFETEDGLHPNGVGAQQVADNLAPILRQYVGMAQ